MVVEVENLDRVLTNFNKVAKLSDSGLKAFTDQAYAAADDVGRTGSGLIDAAAEFRRAGYGLDESLDLGKDALMVTNISDGITSTADAASKLIAVQYRVNHGAGSAIDQLLLSLAQWVNTTSMQEIDPDVIQAVKALVPLLENIDSADVAKAIIDHDKKIVPIRQEGSDYEE
jgi:hypothetical protein